MKTGNVAKSIKTFSKRAIKFIDDNSPAILTGFGILGSITGCVLAGKAAVKAHYILKDKHAEEAEKGIQMKKHEQIFSDVTAVASTMAPVVIVEAASVACIFGSYKINTKRLAALAAITVAKDKDFKEYRDKVKELLGDKKDEEIQREVIKDKIENMDDDDIIETTTNDILNAFENGDIERFYDPKSGRIFVSTRNKIREAVSDFNEGFDQGEMWKSLNEFYGIIGLDYTDPGEKYQFTGDRRLEMRFGDAIESKGKACIPLMYEALMTEDRSW